MFGTRLTATSGNSKLYSREKIAELKHLFPPFCNSQFTWLLDSQPILDVSSLHRYAMGQFVDISGDVISHLNISHVRPEDGGLYKCIATNAVTSVAHSARLNIFGPPYVRAISPIKAIAGEDLMVQCPFSGYPIDNIRWEKAGIEITSSEYRSNIHRSHHATLKARDFPQDSRYQPSSIQQGGFLKINQIDPSHDAGSYTCIVRSRSGEEARRDIQINVNSPPVIEPFYFPKSLQENGRAQISCSVSSGDMPVYFTWYKDGSPLSLSLQVRIVNVQFYTLECCKYFIGNSNLFPIAGNGEERRIFLSAGVQGNHVASQWQIHLLRQQLGSESELHGRAVCER